MINAPESEFRVRSRPAAATPTGPKTSVAQLGRPRPGWADRDLAGPTATWLTHTAGREYRNNTALCLIEIHETKARIGGPPEPRGDGHLAPDLLAPATNADDPDGFARWKRAKRGSPRSTVCRPRIHFRRRPYNFEQQKRACTNRPLKQEGNPRKDPERSGSG